MPNTASQAVGNGDYIVKQGDCLSSIAEKYGMTWQKIWNDPPNQNLRQIRLTPNVLLPGDRLSIPTREQRIETGATEQRHRFRRKSIPAKLRLRLLEGGQPQANVQYTLIIEGEILSGTTDSDGLLEAHISPSAKEGMLRITEGDSTAEYRLALGHIDPIETISGAQGRLHNLGYDPGTVDGQAGPRTRNTLRAFQKDYDLDITGEFDAATCDKLKDIYGG